MINTVVTVYTYERTAEYDPRYYNTFCSLSDNETVGGDYAHDKGKSYILPVGYREGVIDGSTRVVLDPRDSRCTIHQMPGGGGVFLMDSRAAIHVLKLA